MRNVFFKNNFMNVSPPPEGKLYEYRVRRIFDRKTPKISAESCYLPSSYPYTLSLGPQIIWEKISWEKRPWGCHETLQRAKNSTQRVFRKNFIQRYSAYQVGSEKHQDWSRELQKYESFNRNMRLLPQFMLPKKAQNS